MRHASILEMFARSPPFDTPTRAVLASTSARLSLRVRITAGINCALVGSKYGDALVVERSEVVRYVSSLATRNWIGVRRHVYIYTT